MTTIGAIAIQERDTAKNTTIQLTEGGSFNQHTNIDRINKYVRGEFWSCEDPTAIFWQLSTDKIPLYAKSVDADTKNFDMYGIGKFNWFKAFVANGRFKKWAREEGLAMTLDDTSTGVATYGSMVWKKSFDVNGDVVLEASNLKNLYFDASVKNIIDSPVVEAHYWTETEIRSRYPDKANEIIKKAPEARDDDNNKAETEDVKYEILERWGEFKKDDEDSKYYHWLGTGSGDAEVELIMDEIKIVNGKPKDFPYFDFHGERLPGRWQGLGVVERLFGLQAQVNTLVNYEAQSDEIASLLLFRTADPDTEGNILDNVRSGQVLQSADLQQMAIDNRFNSSFINKLQIIEDKANKLCFINDTISGDTPPSGVPFRSTALASRAAVSTFKYIKTAMLEKMGVVLQFEIMPDIVKEFNKEDLYDIMEDDLDIRLYDQMKIEDGIKDFMKKEARKGIMYVDQAEIAKEAQRLQTKFERGGRQENIKIDWDWGIRMNVTGESVDKAAKNAAIDAVTEIMITAPAAINTPIVQQKMEDNGINPFRLTVPEQQAIEQSQGKAPEVQEQDKLSQLAAV